MTDKEESTWQNWLTIICILCGGFYCGLSYLNAKPVLHQLNIQQSLEVNDLKNPLGITDIDRSYNFNYAHSESETEMGQYAGTMIIYDINPNIAQKILATNGAYLNSHSPYPNQFAKESPQNHIIIETHKMINGCLFPTHLREVNL